MHYSLILIYFLYLQDKQTDNNMKNSKKSAFGYGFANELSYQEVTGLSKREYFAVLAMQGLISNSGQCQTFAENRLEPIPGYVADFAVELADALLERLEK